VVSVLCGEDPPQPARTMAAMATAAVVVLAVVLTAVARFNRAIAREYLGKFSSNVFFFVSLASPEWKNIDENWT
jgi:hypothetical protein